MLLEKRQNAFGTNTFLIGNEYGFEMEVGLGKLREMEPDPRNYPLREDVERRMKEGKLEAGDLEAIVHHYNNGWWGNQLDTSQCVGFGCMHAYEDGPINHAGVGPIISPTTIYDYAQKVDEWPGSETEAPAYEGTSVRAGGEAMKFYGLIESYWFTDDFEVMSKALRLPVKDGGNCIIIGSDWDESMFSPDKNGFIKPDGNAVGGHCYKLDGINLKKQILRFKNSWGRTWAKRGMFYMMIEDFKELMARPWGMEIMMIKENPDMKKKIVNMVEEKELAA